MFYFVLGVLSVFALFLIGVLIFGMVKLLKLVKHSKNFDEYVSREFESIHRRIGENRREFEIEFQRNHTDIDQKFKDLYSYTDSRIDKSLNGKK